MEPELLEGFRLSVSSFLNSVLEGSLHREVKDLISDTLRRVSRCGCSGDVMTSPQLHQLSSQVCLKMARNGLDKSFCDVMNARFCGSGVTHQENGGGRRKERKTACWAFSRAPSSGCSVPDSAL